MTKPLQSEPETFSLFGKPLYRMPLRPETEAQQSKLYEEALKNWEKDPDNPDNIIWLGRRTAYLGRYREANGIYSMGIKKHPDDPRLYRHRGHRFITLRMLDQAIFDFKKASELMVAKPDEIEPDGQPNPRGIPVSTLYFNVWYHLGLAYYLKADYENALKAYNECMKVSEIDDKYVATAHWTYMTLRLLDQNAEASKILDKVKSVMDIIENHNYHSCLLMYKGLNTPEKLIVEAREEGALGLVTTGYGVANWYRYNNQEEKAVKILREILSMDGWAGFGYIAAEADMKHMGMTL